MVSTQTLIVGPGTDPDKNAKGLKKLRDEAIQAQNEMRRAREWDRMKRMYMGRFWYDGNGRKTEVARWKANASNPALWEIVQRFVPVLTARKPKFVPSPRGSEDALMARMLGVAADYEWECQGMRRKVAMEAKMALIFGNGLLYTGVHAGLRSDDLYTKVMTPYEVFPDPGATSMEDMLYCFFRFELTRRQLAALLGPFAKKILPKLEGRGSSQSPDKPDQSKFRFAPTAPDEPLIGTIQASRTATAQDTEIIGPQTARYGEERRYVVYEGWFPESDDSEVTKEVDGEELVFPVKGKGRRVLLVEDLYFDELDTENPFRHGQIPLSVMSVDDFPSEFWAQSYLLPGADRAELIADLDNQFSNHIRLTMNPGWKIPGQAGIPPGTVYSYPGMQLLYNHPYEPTQFDAPEIPAGAFQHRTTLKRELDDAYGMNSIARGNIDGGITHASGQTVSALQAPSSDRMAVVLGSLEDSISRWGYQTICNAAQFWTEEKWRRILPMELQVIEVPGPPDLLTGEPTMTQQLVPLPWEDEVDELTGEPIKRDYDVFMPDIKMETGSSLPEDKNTRMSTAFNLADRGAFGDPTGAVSAKQLLDTADWPDKESIIQHVAMEQEARMQMQQAPEEPDFGGGQNKALGGKRSPASEQSVKSTGREVAA